MRKLLILILFSSLFANSQQLQTINTYGYSYKRVKSDTLMGIPNDTLTVPTNLKSFPWLARKNNTLYMWSTTDNKWNLVSGSTYTGSNGIELNASDFRLGNVSPTGSALTRDAYIFGNSLYGVRFNNARFAQDTGTRVTSANSLTLGKDGNIFYISDTTRIKGIDTIGWQAGSIVHLFFLNYNKVMDSISVGANMAKIKLDGNVDSLVMQPGDYLGLMYNGGYWNEIGRGSRKSNTYANIYNSDGTQTDAVRNWEGGNNSLYAKNFQEIFWKMRNGNDETNNASYYAYFDGVPIIDITSSSPRGFSLISVRDTIINIAPVDTLNVNFSNGGYSGYTNFKLNTILGNNRISNQLITKYTDNTDASRTSQLIITGVNSGTIGDILTLNGNKSVQLNGYTSNAFTGTPTNTLQVDASGNVIMGSVAGGGTQSKSAFIEFPAAADTVIMFVAPVNLTITSVKSVNTGGSSASVTFQLYKGTDRSSGTAILSGAATTTSITTLETDSSFSSASVTAGQMVWVVITSGAGNGIHYTINYTND